MTTMKKGFAALCLVMVLAGGTVAAANSLHGSQVPAKATVTNARAVVQSDAPAPVSGSESAPAEATKETSTPAGHPGLVQAAPADQTVPAPSDRRMASPTLSVTNLSYTVADEQAARVNVIANGVLRNSNKGPINLRDVKVMLQDAEGKVTVPARIEVVSGGKETLGRGEEAEVRLIFAGVPADAGHLQLALHTPAGGTVVNAITITITCTWPPLKCSISIGFSQ